MTILVDENDDIKYFRVRERGYINQNIDIDLQLINSTQYFDMILKLDRALGIRCIAISIARQLEYAHIYSCTAVRICSYLQLHGS